MQQNCSILRQVWKFAFYFLPIDNESVVFIGDDDNVAAAITWIFEEKVKRNKRKSKNRRDLKIFNIYHADRFHIIWKKLKSKS